MKFRVSFGYSLWSLKFWAGGFGVLVPLTGIAARCGGGSPWLVAKSLQSQDSASTIPRSISHRLWSARRL